MSNRNTWIIVASLLGLGALYTGMWLYDKAEYRESIRQKYRAMKAAHLGEESWDETRYKLGDLSYEEKRRKREARIDEDHRFFNEYSKILGNP